MMNKEGLKLKYGDTKVFAVKDEYIKGLLSCNRQNYGSYEQQLESLGQFIYRYEAEINFEYRQIIPYCLLRYEDRFFATQRLKGDSRLVDQYSLGIGGHIEKVDRQQRSLIRNGLKRELSEEVDILSGIDSLDMAGIIYSDATEVDRVHFGLVYIALLKGPDVQVKETDKLKGMWIDRSDLLKISERFEVWSQICLRNFVI